MMLSSVSNAPPLHASVTLSTPVLPLGGGRGATLSMVGVVTPATIPASAQHPRHVAARSLVVRSLLSSAVCSSAKARPSVAIAMISDDTVTSDLNMRHRPMTFEPRDLLNPQEFSCSRARRQPHNFADQLMPCDRQGNSLSLLLYNCRSSNHCRCNPPLKIGRASC